VCFGCRFGVGGVLIFSGGFCCFGGFSWFDFWGIGEV